MNIIKIAVAVYLFTIITGCTTPTNQTKTKPNFVIILLDDSGWEDFHPFGKPNYPTPNVELLAKEGGCFTSFYVPQAICTASRAALLTGCYPGRTKAFGAHTPGQEGLDTCYTTLSEALKQHGYATALFGKWHLGDQEHTRPHARGFDETAGLMYSNDMWRHHPQWRDYDQWTLQYWENGQITKKDLSPEDQKLLTKSYTEKSVDFINKHKGEPFFLYVPHSMPHVPLYCSDEFKGKSGQGIYGDVIKELDWSIGQITNALKTNGLDDNTVVVLTSDNGPWIFYGNHGGTTPFRAGKTTCFNGGKRSACIIKYPPLIEAGTKNNKTFCSIDIMPSFLSLAGINISQKTIDGKDISNLWSDKKDAMNPHKYYPLSIRKEFQGVISADGRWKLLLPHKYRYLEYPGKDGLHGKYIRKDLELTLFDLVNDSLETTNVIDKHPGVAQRLMLLAQKHKETFYSK